MDINIEELRRRLIDEVNDAMLLGLTPSFLEEGEIMRASDRELIEIARAFGFEV